MKKRILAVALLLAAFQLDAQVQQLGTPISWKEKVGVSKKTVYMEPVDNVTEAANEYQRRATSLEKNMRFGKEMTVDINVMQTADVTILPNGDVLRQLTIQSDGAYSINLIFSQFKLSSNARMYLFDGNKTEFVGAHTSLNNNINNMLGTELIHDDILVIELVEPANEAGTSILTLGTVVHGYIDLEEELKAIGDSGDCNYDVNCPISAGWENQRNSVAMMMNGGGFCTGSLINNTSGTIIPYFLSANHCGTTPGGWVFRFRWERTAANAICATANGTSNNGPTNMNVNGGVLRANYAPSDFTLTELNAAPDPAWGVYYNGWNATNTPATSAVGIHHPSGDIKKISFENTPLISTTFGSSPANSHWGVTSWDDGVTEGGSSGSPLFDQNHRVVGQLHGGASACGASQLSDEYGKIYTSWLGGGTNATQLKYWLDPSNSGATEIDGVDPSGPGVSLDAGLNSPQGVSGTICAASVTPSITIINSGSDPLTQAVINYGYDGSTGLVYNWSGNLAQYQTAVINLPSQTLAGGAHTFSAQITSANGSADMNAGNDVTSSSFTTIVNALTVDFALNTDCYGDEVTWFIRDTTGATVFYNGGPYTQTASGTTVNNSYCLSGGCYKLTFYDDFGDGMASSTWCSISGSFQLTDASNQVLAEIDQNNVDFGDSIEFTFCLSGAGLTDLLGEKWSIYPNPTDKDLTIALGDIEGAKTITVLSAAGQVLKQMETSEMNEQVSITGLAKGVYFVTLDTTLGRATKSFIVK